MDWRGNSPVLFAWNSMTNTISVGDHVQKVSGYRWPGIVVSVFETTKQQTRIVVECTVPEVAGALHIYNLNQVEKVTV